MKKDIDSKDTISEGTLHEILLDIKYRIVKLIKQNNSIVKFLASIDVEPVDGLGFEDMEKLPPIDKNKSYNVEKMKEIKELVEEFMDRHESLKELEKELKKNKDMLTPGQMGES